MTDDYSQRLQAARARVAEAERTVARLESREEMLRERARAVKEQLDAEGITHRELPDVIKKVEEELQEKLEKIEQATSG